MAYLHSEREERQTPAQRDAPDRAQQNSLNSYNWVVGGGWTACVDDISFIVRRMLQLNIMGIIIAFPSNYYSSAIMLSCFHYLRLIVRMGWNNNWTLKGLSLRNDVPCVARPVRERQCWRLWGQGTLSDELYSL